MADLPPESKIVPAEDAATKTASATAFAPSRGFHANDTGTVTVTMNNGASVSFYVVAGQCYPYGIKAYTAGTPTIVAVY